MGIKKTMSLKSLFFRFLLTLIAFLLVAIAIPVLLLLFGVTIGYLTPANLNEATLQEAQTKIGSAQEFTAALVPQGMEYVLLDKSLSVLESGMSENNTEKAVLFAKGEHNNSMNSEHFMLITRETEYVVIKYTLQSGYTSKTLNAVLPPPEIFCYILIGICGVLACVTSTLLFAKKVSKQIIPLHDAAKQIGKQNLDFEVGHSNIRELNNVLLSFDNMKSELKRSLEKQWKDEQNQKEQIAALAHDLKTPLTVIIGNADLLQETKLDKEQAEYAKNLLEYSGYVEQSVMALIDLSKAACGHSVQLKTIDMQVFIAQIKTKLSALATLKEIQLEFLHDGLPKTLTCDIGLIERMLLNIVANAVDFTPQGGVIRFEVKKDNANLLFTVTDSGVGFSKEALSQGKQHFYMGDAGRSSRKHYGMGLTIADTIAVQHGGKLILENGNADLSGGMVTIIIPLA